MASIREDLIKYTPRKEQNDCYEYVTNIWKNEPEKKFILLDLPPGIGKSHIAMMLSDYYIKSINYQAKIDIITAGKILQDQYSNTYDSINNLKGKENYECSQYTCSCAQGKEFNKIHKSGACDGCPYDSSKKGYINGKVSLTNFHLYLIYAMFNNGNMQEQRKASVLIVDEADIFDDVMSDFISIKITETVIKKMKFDNESQIISGLKAVNNITQYVEYLRNLRVEINNNIARVEAVVNTTGFGDKVSLKRDLKLAKIMDEKNSEVKLMQIITDLKQYILKIDIFLTEYENTPENWVLESVYNEKTKTKDLSMEPIWANGYLEKYVWSKYDKVVLMSGTILDKYLFSELNGLDIDEVSYYSVESPFPIENRLIYYKPLGKMSFNKKEETFKTFVPFISKILKKYTEKKGIIHTNSLELATWIERDIKNPRLIFHDSANRDEMLKRHFDSSDPVVFVSPSISTGVSFDYEQSRFQIIAKIPYPSLASQKNKQRQKSNPEWMPYRTVAKLIQMCSRSIRSKTDKADTFILDSCYSDIDKYSSKYIPLWFGKAIVKMQ